MTFQILILLILLLIFYLKWYKHSALNTTLVTVQGESYNVHRQHHDPKKAAELLDEIVNRNKVFIEHLSTKYSRSNNNVSVGNGKEGRIDIIPYSGTSGGAEDAIMNEMEYLETDMTYLAARVTQLKDQYQIDNIYEISPLNPSGSTSYTENKGEKLVLCLRDKKPNAEGQHEFHDINTLMFVVLHELTHIMNDRWGHKMQYWKLFKFVLKNADEAGIYNPVNYREQPITYCGMNITYNPFHDASL